MNLLKQLYIEPTSKCNLQCPMCSLASRDEDSTGHMEQELFDKVISEIPDSVNRIFFGGIGEPLSHPHIIYMLNKAKQTGCKVELITNGTLLDETMSDNLVKSQLDVLWVSLDSLEESSYEDIRSGACFGSVMDNIRVFNEKRFSKFGYVRKYSPDVVKLGAMFVLMKNNLGEFTKLLQSADKLGLSDIKATHLIPYSQAQIEQICYERVLTKGMYSEPVALSTKVDIPFMDIRDIPGLLGSAANPVLPFSVAGTPLWIKNDYCKFIEEGITYLRWDGEICPCMALLHDNTVYQKGNKRTVKREVGAASFGNAKEKTLPEIWTDEEYTAFRRRVSNSEFAPCTRCSPDMCDYIKNNEKDCFNNTFPTCGACLWGQGLIQCP